jgi:ubiquinone/menaquinone biosynthesis C-methylase UbiE
LIGHIAQLGGFDRTAQAFDDQIRVLSFSVHRTIQAHLICACQADLNWLAVGC